jgi:hypothetical protein
LKISEIARVNIKQDSTIFNDMVGCDLVSRLQQNEMKSKDTYKRNKNINKKSKGKR